MAGFADIERQYAQLLDQIRSRAFVPVYLLMGDEPFYTDRLCDAIVENALDEEIFSSLLDSAGVPDPELLIRPGGEMRISNFLMWQSASSELVFTDTLWPDFGPKDIDAAILEYQKRNRRFGGI